MATTGDQQYVDHELLVPEFIERRMYQLQLAGSAKDRNTLVCLPTGLGKTTVSLLVTAERLADVGGKSLLLAPTKPLVNQHADFYREALRVPDDDIVVFTGEVRPDERTELWQSASVVIATPQVVENDLVGSRIDLRDVTHVTFDECHRATGDYAYNYIAERYHQDAEDPLVTGMSASPGGDEEEILEVCENLGIDNVEVMTEEDSDVEEYTHDTDVEWERVELPDEVLEIRDTLNEVVEDRLAKLKELGITKKTSADLSETDIKKMRAELQQLIDNDQSEGYQGMSALAEIRKLRTAVTYVETQSVEALRRYFERQRNAAKSSGASKASQRFVSEPKVKEAMRRAEKYDDLHPKYSRARMRIAETLGIQDGERVIVFTESRDTAEALTEFLGQHFDTQRFVGQGDKEGSDGMTQKQQQEVLDRFRGGDFEVLVSTSVAEEGLDVPEVDLVLFYEPVPTAIRSIQRKGRTGRQAEGRVAVLLAEDTRDEAYFWISKRREDEMEEEMRKLKGVADEVEEELDDSQRQLGDFDAGGSGGSGDGDGDSRSDVEPGLQTFDASDGEGDEATDQKAESGDGTADATEIADDEEGVVATAEPDDETVEIVADQRELDSTIARDLSTREGIETRLETLSVGDYVLSDRVVVERKSVADFLDTLTGGDRSMFEQVGDATRHYARPVVILEGEGLYEERNVHPNAIRGALSSLAVDFGASVLRTEDEDDTADLLEVIAAREQEADDREVSVHGEKASKTLAEQQEYVVSSIADIGPVTARSLLEEFKTVEAVMTAREDDLLEVQGVGEVTAERIREVVGSEYDR
ncbi:DEAD/DEAH box helicase [Halorussus limi]|uniref:DEAD/DEAH box helicase n=1 Tax=Halorussus limi TaxID=2938695 RepID=A0A8U0HX76_9EURY|nr:DEAD/DEAH box helicase [Halorussus limi]UPV75712.1 DEAD/DEAH box helicase [Halorussus limi]